MTAPKKPAAPDEARQLAVCLTALVTMQPGAIRAALEWAAAHEQSFPLGAAFADRIAAQTIGSEPWRD